MRLLVLLFATTVASLLTGCTLCTDPDVPEPACSTPAAVRYPVCYVANCSEHPILLVLNDGQELRPFGTDWEAFQTANATALPEQVMISYKPEATPAVHTWQNATITCISAAAQ